MDDLDALKSGNYTTPDGAHGQIESPAAVRRNEARKHEEQDRHIHQVNRDLHKLSEISATPETHDQHAQDALNAAKGTSHFELIPLSQPVTPPVRYSTPYVAPIRSDPGGTPGNSAGTGITAVFITIDSGVVAKQATVIATAIADYP